MFGLALPFFLPAAVIATIAVVMIRRELGGRERADRDVFAPRVDPALLAVTPAAEVDVDPVRVPRGQYCLGGRLREAGERAAREQEIAELEALAGFDAALELGREPGHPMIVTGGTDGAVRRRVVVGRRRRRQLVAAR